MKCALCGTTTTFFTTTHKRTYHSCNTCYSIALDTCHFLASNQEKNRYLQHNDNIHDLGYQKFVTPIVDTVLQHHTAHQKGLDFGSGNAPVVTHLLQKEGYAIYPYDPFFEPNALLLQKTYDYIVCCEVMEHFYNPSKEFGLLSSLLNKGGNLYCKTNLFDSSINFDTWWYKNDATHVFFYSKKTLEWIQKHFGFTAIETTNKLIIFSK